MESNLSLNSASTLAANLIPGSSFSYIDSPMLESFITNPLLHNLTTLDVKIQETKFCWKQIAINEFI